MDRGIAWRPGNFQRLHQPGAAGGPLHSCFARQPGDGFSRGRWLGSTASHHGRNWRTRWCARRRIQTNPFGVDLEGWRLAALRAALRNSGFTPRLGPVRHERPFGRLEWTRRLEQTRLADGEILSRRFHEPDDTDRLA